MILQDLKNKHAGSRAVIVGKGPSLDTLFDQPLLQCGDTVIALNESGRVCENHLWGGHVMHGHHRYTVQQDCTKELTEKCKPQNGAATEHLMNCWHTFSTQRRKVATSPWNPNAILYDPEEFGENNCQLSAIMAMYLAKYMGCDKVLFVCFDSWIDGGSCEYAQCIPAKSGDAGEPGRHRSHRDYILLKAREIMGNSNCISVDHPRYILTERR